MKIQLGETEYELTFNMGFLKMMYKEFGIDPLNLAMTTGPDYFNLATAIVYCGIAATNKKAAKDAPDKAFIESQVDELHVSALTKIAAAFSEWMTTPEEVIDKNKKGAAGDAATFQVAQP